MRLTILTIQDVAERQLCCGCGACAYHRELDWTGFAETAMLNDGILTLPIHQELTDADIDLIGECVQHVAYLLNRKRPYGGTAAMQNLATTDKFVGQLEWRRC